MRLPAVWSVTDARVRYERVARVASLAAIAALGATLGLGRWALPGGFALCAVLGLGAALARRGRALAGGELRLADDASNPLRHSEIEAGWVVPGPASARVEFRLRGGRTYSATLPDTEAANEVLEAAGFDARRRALRVVLGTAFDGAWRAGAALVFGGLQTLPLLVLFTAWLGIGSTARAVFFAATALAGLVAATRFLGPAELVIGADGLSVQRGFRPRFLPYRLLRWVEAEGADIVLLLDGAQRIRVSATSRDEARAAMVVERIRRAASAARGDEGTAALSLLDRQGRDARSWTAALRALAAGPGSYRGVALTDADLERVVGDATASAERRIGAAVALSARGDEAARTRVRIAVEACANEAMRGALDAALRGELDDDHLSRADHSADDVREMRRGLGV